MEGMVASGDKFFASSAGVRDLRERLPGVCCVEMEGAAVAQVAAQFNAPSVVVRCLSDLAGGESHLDFPAFLPFAAEMAAQVLRRIVPVL